MSAESVADYDVVIVGAGLAGASLALAVADLPLKVALVEAQTVREGWPQIEESVFDYDARVSALTEGSRQFLDELGVWSDIVSRRACAYSDMDVWDGEGTGRIHFSASEVRREALGHIVENRLINAALVNRLREHTRVKCYFGMPVASMSREPGLIRLGLEGGAEIRSPLVVAADGANSKVRDWAGFVTREWDYHHHAIVATVETEHRHCNTAWQRFLPEGPLAFLPLPDTAGDQHYCSIVWSVKPELAEQLMSLEDDAFCSALAAKFEHRLGAVVASSRRFSFPLRQRHAADYVCDGVVLLGDAAHTIHPLAGQGINLGFQDAKVLAEECRRALARGLNVADETVLNRYQRRRKGGNLAMMAMMEGFQHLFETPAMPLRLLRNTGMRWLDSALPLKRQIIARAMGLTDGEGKF
ncbi:2-octaprenylphenol hydroxylase [Zhongshania aliphaticivorans]|uniref:2-octaprenylphenol hydroxylase n=1 Tax=Zhongshania aliphaticivorans TaxID=1470434 RepID=A0A5S9MSU7_9GAMM|nr:UbiH/UbiF/VisC/COQ6 family ubiquinone biosynthesis hydroxylase [Zhongshania aliphaticivorans]CAA0079915.1 2-octaprenylphenol hydroxylase [Zhongshania aliphaticivorans]CAA0085970.1 2-octaprenylphenol hydroxylase [Zhongshania aliphaticivorans]